MEDCNDRYHVYKGGKTPVFTGYREISVIVAGNLVLGGASACESFRLSVIESSLEIRFFVDRFDSRLTAVLKRREGEGGKKDALSRINSILAMIFLGD